MQWSLKCLISHHEHTIWCEVLSNILSGFGHLSKDQANKGKLNVHVFKVKAVSGET